MHARFTTSNVNEALPGVLAPLTWSFYYPPVELSARAAWHRLGATGRADLRIPDEVDQRFFTPVLGHAASNVELFGRMADRMPGGSARRMEQQLFGAVGHSGATERFRHLRYPLIAAKAGPTVRRAMRSLEPLAADIERWWRDSVSRDDDPDAGGALRQLAAARDRLTELLGTHLILTMACQGVMERVAAVADHAGLTGLEHELVRSEQGTTEFQLVADLRALAAERIDLPTFLARHGYHGPREGQLDAVVWREDPGPVLALLGAYRERGGPAPEDILAHRRAEHEVACARFEQALGRVRSVPARRLVRFAAHAPVWRETGRAAILRCVDVARHAARRHGRDLAERGVLDAPQDVFLLTVDEVLSGVEGDPRTVVERRRRQAERYAGVALPQVWRGKPERAAPAPMAAADTRVVPGIGVSSGTVEGVVQVVHDQREADLAEGAVLVCAATDPGWASLFPLAVAVVTDVGSSMSHAAIVCRELGLPCVANTRDGTRLLRDGMRVRVDGSAGVVEILGGS